jgi:hypothetical protein
MIYLYITVLYLKSWRISRLLTNQNPAFLYKV